MSLHQVNNENIKLILNFPEFALSIPEKLYLCIVEALRLPWHCGVKYWRCNAKEGELAGGELKVMQAVRSVRG
jgi:hypothetical protein